MKNYEMHTMPPAYQFFDSAFGNVVTFDAIRADPDSYSSVFCEGSVALRELLKDLWQNGVETRGCCIGHENVHTYVKDTILGKRELIDEATYRAHAKSKRYHEYIDDAHAYVAFVPGDLGDAEELRSRIEAIMKERLPELSYATNAFPDLVTISLDRYVPAIMRERFFYVLTDVFHRDVLHSREPSFKQAEPEHKRKAPLSEQIANAQSKTAGAGHDKHIFHDLSNENGR